MEHESLHRINLELLLEAEEKGFDTSDFFHEREEGPHSRETLIQELLELDLIELEDERYFLTTEGYEYLEHPDVSPLDSNRAKEALEKEFSFLNSNDLHTIAKRNRNLFYATLVFGIGVTLVRLFMPKAFETAQPDLEIFRNKDVFQDQFLIDVDSLQQIRFEAED